jgi:large subunit ribosomal protein L28e
VDGHTGKNNSYLVKRTQAGGVQLSRDPLNLTNKHSRKQAGFANEKGIGIHPDSNTVSIKSTADLRLTLTDTR